MRISPALVAVTAALLAVPSAAAAGNVSATSKKIQSASAAVSSCGTLSSIGVSWTVTADVINSAALTSIPAACDGASLSITFVDSSNASLGSAGPVTITGTSQTLSTITGSPTASAVANAYVSVVGP